MKQTKSLTVGAMTIALTMMIMMLDRITTGFFMTFLGIPLVVYGSYYDLKNSVIVYVACIVMTFILTAYLPTILLMLGYGGMGLATVYTYKKNMKKWQSYFFTYLLSLPFYFVMIYYFGQFFGVDIQASIDLVANIIPVESNELVANLFVWLNIMILPALEVWLIRISAYLVTNLLKQRYPNLLQ